MKLSYEEINILLDSLVLLKLHIENKIQLEVEDSYKEKLLDFSDKITYIKEKLTDSL